MKRVLRSASIARRARVEKGLQNRINSARRAALSASRIVASSPDQKCKSNDQNQDNQHPVLAFDSKNVKWLNEELHRDRPFLVQFRRFDEKRILFLYLIDGATQWRGLTVALRLNLQKHQWFRMPDRPAVCRTLAADT